MSTLLRPADVGSRRARRARQAGLAARILALWLLPVAAAFGQAFSPGSISVGIDATPEELREAINAVAAREGLEEDIRSRIIEQLNDAILQVRNRQAAVAAAQAYTRAMQTAPAETARLRALADEEYPGTQSEDSLDIGPDIGLAELEQRLAGAQAELATLDARLQDLDRQIDAGESRPVAARARQVQLRRSAEELDAAIEAPPPPGEPQLLTDARRLAAALRRSAQVAEINALDQELLSHPVRLNLLKAQRDAVSREWLGVERRVGLLVDAVNSRRQASAQLAQQAAIAAELAAAGEHTVVRELAEGNVALTRDLPALATSIERANGRLERVRDDADNLEERFDRSRQRLEVAGLNRALGNLLLEERRTVPRASRHDGEIRALGDRLADVGLAQIRIQEERRDLTPLSAKVEEQVAEAAETISAPEELEQVREEIRLLLRDRRDLLVQVDNAYAIYLQVLGDLESETRRLFDVSAAYGEFLGQNLLWIPSDPIAFKGAWGDILSGASRMLSPAAWVGFVRALGNSVREHAGTSAVALLLVVFLLGVRPPMSRRLAAINSRVGRLATDHIGLTLVVLGFALLRALPVPLGLLAAGWLLEHSGQTAQLSAPGARALYTAAPFLFNLLFFRVICAAGGLLDVHFGWHPERLAVIRRQLDRLIVIGGPLVFATALFYSSEITGDRTTLGRLAFVALMLLLAAVLQPLAHPSGGIAASYYQRKPRAWTSRLRWLWYGLAVGMPILLALASLLGYVYTSLVLTGLFVNSTWLVLALIVVNLIVLRWLTLARRKLGLQIALQQKEARRVGREKQADRPQPESEELPPARTETTNLDAVDEQTRKLLKAVLLLVALVGGWQIWSGVLPVFGLLDDVALWSQTVTVEGIETIAPVTLADVLLAAVVLFLTTVAAINLPGLMEIAILQRLTLQPGSRYAANTLVRYFVVTVGVATVLDIIGWNWSQIQWLVAALGVGLGFGLQEIVANFVSGLVILFERPVRVGDTVTVGELTGTVSRVRIRATTITDWDRKEIIVPNKAFITEEVVNWTLSDPITRIVIPVGISYGSDIELAHQVMEDTLRSLPIVLDEPEPHVYFLGFGESSLDFKLYVFSRQLTDRLPLMHAVHNAILKALREHGIEIPFPQRDLHIRSTVEKSS